MTSPTRSLIEILIFQVPDGQEENPTENPTKNPVWSVISLTLQMAKPNWRSGVNWLGSLRKRCHIKIMCFFLLRSLVTTGILCIEVLIGSTE